MLIKYFPQDTKIPFMRLRWFGYAVSLILLVISAFTIWQKGLNLGLDFTGGLLLEVRSSETIDQMRTRINTLEYSSNLQTFGDDSTFLIRAQIPESITQQQALSTVKAALPKDAEYRRIEYVGPTVGQTLIQDGIIAVCAALAAIMFYIWLRFEWQYGINALIALTHDVILILGLFSLLQVSFDLSTVAAILTVAGYSMNDSVVIFDYIRDTLRRNKDKPTSDVIDIALNRTMVRTFATSVSTLLTLLALYFFGGAVIQGFALALIAGVVVGTWSSLFVGAPLLLAFNLKYHEDDDVPASAQI